MEREISIGYEHRSISKRGDVQWSHGAPGVYQHHSGRMSFFSTASSAGHMSIPKWDKR